MKWKTVLKVAKVVAVVVVPGAAGYVAYKYVVRPWFDERVAKGKQTTSPSSEDQAPEERLEEHEPASRE